MAAQPHLIIPGLQCDTALRITSSDPLVTVGHARRRGVLLPRLAASVVDDDLVRIAVDVEPFDGPQIEPVELLAELA